MAACIAPSDARPLLELKAVSKTVQDGGPPIVLADRIDLRIHRSDTLAIVGASGSGKSSLLEVMGTLAAPQSGQVLFDGIDVYTAKERARTMLRRNKIGFVFQNANLIDYLTAAECVALPLKYQGVAGRSRRKIALEWLQHVGLQDKANTLANRLSGGERQRVGLARALVTQPDLILADEPTGSLDQTTGEDVLRLLLKMTQRQRALVVVTHNMAHARHFDRVVRMDKGTLSNITGENHAARL